MNNRSDSSETTQEMKSFQMAAKRLSLSFTANQLGQEGLSPAPRGLVLSELSNLLNEIEGLILSGKMQFDLSELTPEKELIHPGQITILQEVLKKAGFDLSIEYKNPFYRQLHLFESGKWVSNALLLIQRL